MKGSFVIPPPGNTLEASIDAHPISSFRLMHRGKAPVVVSERALTALGPPYDRMRQFGLKGAATTMSDFSSAALHRLPAPPSS